MTEWVPRRSCPRGNHLPPADVTPYIRVVGGKRQATKKLLLPASELGVPDPVEIVDTVLGTIDESYEWPQWTNVHHFCYPHHSYQTELEHAYRESPTLKGTMPIQFHNYLHSITRPPEKPSQEIMQLRVDEDNRAAALFSLGRHAIQLTRRALRVRDQASHRDELRWAEAQAEYYEGLRRVDLDTFERIVDTMPEGIFGILPDREWLTTAQLGDIVTRLGQVTVMDAIDFREVVQRVPVRQSA